MRRLWPFVLVVLALVVLSGPLLAADGAKSTKDKVQFGAFISAWTASINLPDGMNFTEGYGSEPNKPKGSIFLVGGQVTAPVAKNARATLQLGFPIFDSDFRTGFTDRQNWRPPGYGETYTYSRLDGMDPVPALKIAFGAFPKAGEKTDRSFISYGVGVERVGLDIQQGYDEWNAEKKFRRVSADSFGWMVFGSWESGGLNIALEIVPSASLDFGNFGTGDLQSINLYASASF